MSLQVKVKGKWLEVHGIIVDIDRGISGEITCIEAHEIEDVIIDDCYLSNKEAIEAIDKIANVFHIE
jgi:hypothetical protein